MDLHWLLACILWMVGSTNYYGNNWTPQSNEELICDIIGVLLFAVSVALGKNYE